MRLILNLLASNKCNAIEIQSAFLQGKQIERPVFLIPSLEFLEKNTVRKLKTCICGLSDTSRTWYLRVKKELCKLGIQCSKFETSVFYYQNKNSLDGIVITHVDDFCWGGTENFRDSIIRPLINILSIGTEFEQIFRYLGLNITQKQNFNITLDQIQFINEIKSVEILRKKMKNKSDLLNENELKSFKTLTG